MQLLHSIQKHLHHFHGLPPGHFPIQFLLKVIVQIGTVHIFHQNVGSIVFFEFIKYTQDVGNVHILQCSQQPRLLQKTALFHICLDFQKVVFQCQRFPVAHSVFRKKFLDRTGSAHMLIISQIQHAKSAAANDAAHYKTVPQFGTARQIMRPCVLRTVRYRSMAMRTYAIPGVYLTHACVAVQTVVLVAHNQLTFPRPTKWALYVKSFGI